MADAFVYLMERVNFKDLISNDSIEIKNSHINIGTGIDITIADLANTIKTIIGFNGLIVWDESIPDGTFQKVLNIDKLKKIGWNFSVDLKLGIKKVYENYILILVL